jgi:hypothetical protein
MEAAGEGGSLADETGVSASRVPSLEQAANPRRVAEAK